MAARWAPGRAGWGRPQIQAGGGGGKTPGAGALGRAGGSLLLVSGRAGGWVAEDGFTQSASCRLLSVFT